MSDVDYESLSRAFLTLLDRIECQPDIPFEIHALCQQRFDIAEEHGITVIFEGTPISGEVQ